MKKIIKMVKANCRNDVKQLIPLFLILIFSSLLFNIGLMMSRYSTFFDRKLLEYQTPDLMYILYGDLPGIKEQMHENDYAREMVFYNILDATTKITCEANQQTSEESISIFDMSENHGLNDLHMLEISEETYEHPIYLCDFLYGKLNAKLGDEIKLSLPDMEERTFRIAGVYENIYMNSYFIGASSLRICHDDFDSMCKEANEIYEAGGSNYFALCSFVNFKKGYNFTEGEAAFLKEISPYTNEAGGACWGINKNEAKRVQLMIPNIVAAICCAVALLVSLISMIITMFVISDNIKRDIKNIGALKAMGYTSANLKVATMLEYTFVSIGASIVGIVVSYLCYPKIEYVIRPMQGVRGNLDFMPVPAAIVVIFFIIVSLTITLSATKRLGKLSPIVALRFGLDSHSFKKNHIPLDRHSGNITILMALKTMMQQKKHNVILICVSMAISIILIFASIVFYNSVIDITAFTRALQGDVPDAYVQFCDDIMNDDASRAALEEELYAMEDVKEINRALVMYASANDVTAYIVACESVETMDCNLTEGVMPQRDNEVVIGSLLAGKLNLVVGSEIEVTMGAVTRKFIVSGIQECFYGMGTRVYMSKQSYETFHVKFESSYFRIKLKEPSIEKVDVFLEQLQETYGDDIVTVENQYKIDRSNENTPVIAVKYVSVLLAIISCFIVLLAISLMVKTEIIDKQREYGIKKSIGFTSNQIRVQLAISMIPIVIIGSVLGSIIGYMIGNDIIALMCSSFAISDLGFITVPVMIPIVCGFVVIYTFVVAFVMSGKVKKITAYQLITE